MKKLTVLLFSILISFSTYGEWTKVVEDTDGDTFYIETSTIKERNGYVYYWELADTGTGADPNTSLEESYQSGKAYNQGDCQINRYKVLLINLYKKPMGEGKKEKVIRGQDVWEYPEPNNVRTTLLSYACNYVK